MFGRFAPSPSGRLHLGNLRTALAAWLAAGLDQHGFIVRIEDLDPVTSSRRSAADQLEDLRALGIGFEPEVVFQSERSEHYTAVIEQLRDRSLVYPCFCTRREIAAAVNAPHDPVPAALGARRSDVRADQQDPMMDPGAVLDLAVERPYPGICRDLDPAEAAERLASGARAAWRLRAERVALQVNDEFVGPIRAFVDDMVLQRADGVVAYNLAVVVDDAAQRISQVVRGDDLLASTPRQVYLQRLLGYRTPRYVHLPLVVNADGQRLAKRDGAVTLEGLAAEGIGPAAVVRALGVSLGIPAAATARSADDLLDAAVSAGFGIADFCRLAITADDLLALVRSGS